MRPAQPIHRCFFSASTPDYVRDLLSRERLRASGFFKPEAVRHLVRKVEEGLAVSETDDMALAGILSTQLVDWQFLSGFTPAPPLGAADDVEVVADDVRECYRGAHRAIEYDEHNRLALGRESFDGRFVRHHNVARLDVAGARDQHVPAIHGCPREGKHIFACRRQQTEGLMPRIGDHERPAGAEFSDARDERALVFGRCVTAPSAGPACRCPSS